MAMTFGIHIGHMGGPLEEMRRLWKFADAQGFDWFSVSDHFQESPPRGGDLDCFEAIATLTAAAVETKRVRLGALVYCVAYRNPGLHAKSLTTIDHLSGGRVDCGLGAGWHEIEARAFGYDFPRIGVREDMLEEYAQIMRMLLDPESRRSSRASPSGSGAAARSGRSGRPRATPTAGTRPISAPRSGSRRARCWTSGARKKGATRRRSPAPSTWGSTWAPTARGLRAERRPSDSTGAMARGALAGSEAPPSRPPRWSPPSATPAAPASTSPSATARTTGTRSARSPRRWRRNPRAPGQFRGEPAKYSRWRDANEPPKYLFHHVSVSSSRETCALSGSGCWDSQSRNAKWL